MAQGMETKERNRNICHLFFGGVTMDEIAKVFGISRERVRQIIQRDCPQFNTKERKHLIYSQGHRNFSDNQKVPCMFCRKMYPRKEMVRADWAKYYCNHCDAKGR